ncbi:cryptochrome/photolyase family protein [Ectobacillus sp. sgz5001026]|uniref:cryptochrome/photolyase family protein n=1 Tax=Ectobacillus sp. sgz5001026 TaxID=3242473 RepID=UPI0036D31E64
MTDTRILVWLRKDFRLYDNPALLFAAKEGKILPLYIYDEQYEGSWPLGSASKWWLHHALVDMKAQLEKRHIPFVIRTGNVQSQLLELVKETNASAVYFNRRYEPDVLTHDKELINMLHQQGIICKTFESHILLDPDTITKPNGDPYKVFTPFYKALQKQTVPFPVKRLDDASVMEGTFESVAISDLHLLPAVHWMKEIERIWIPTEEGAYKTLNQFLAKRLGHYQDGRDFPAIAMHSSLAPYYAFGQLSPRLVYYYIKRKLSPSIGVQGESYLRQLVWREFAYHLLLHFPHTTKEPLLPAFQHFPWKEDDALFQAWTKGRTGYPFVDAGMRELWNTGFMHNRVRMVVASFLVKHLLIPWQRGAAWFWDTLLDADLANNTMGWQWVAGSGADAAPYFRIFNPITQGEKFDTDGEYVRRWIPELKDLPNKYIHRPWEANNDVLQSAKITLGVTYPYPIVNHVVARKQALSAYEEMKAKVSK